jgi:hypothetical protein
MINKLFLVSILMLGLFTNKSLAQDFNVVKFRFGVQNHKPHGLPESLKEMFTSSSLQFELFVDRRFLINEKYALNGGLGFSIFQFADANLFFDGVTAQSNYGILKYGLSRAIYKDKFNFNVDVFHYILVHKEKQDDRQRRAFTNLEIGVAYKINNRFNVSVGSFLSITPMSLLRLGTGNFMKNEPLTTYISGVYNLGMNAGLGYSF